ncbi:hypothetical protein [Pseudomonas chlororaphis]|uniref:hypothetical protein n=1 Tax=Pseudomonas chlororaphis TaxID=587753 RepID=UPI0023683581|nr:hypothetical protein [Pseudomonas chlororaphis]WDH32406.1 hypothetical protein PUP62_16190 [Pseudomonas chlororaphis]WDH38490.1 hypothetical protein PUP51_16195 [Pseudomonas chlororaphis]
MSVYRIYGDKLLSKTAFAVAIAESGNNALEAEDFLTNVAADTAYAATSGLETTASPAVTQFVPIGAGKPLTILIREIYTGRFPARGFLGSSSKPMAVVTGLKDYSAYAATSRAMNFLLKDVKPHTRFKAPSTFTDGTNVVAYSPAVVTDSFHFTIEIAFDKFDESFFEMVSKGLATAAGIPLLIPAAGYLLAASGVVKIGAGVADGLIDGEASFSVTDSFDFNLPGTVAPVADFRVLCHFDANGMTYDPVRGLLNPNGTVYQGDEPYAVISLDGAVRKNLESFSVAVATAGIMKQFFNMRDGAEVISTSLTDAVKLASDIKYRSQAVELQRQIILAVGAEKNELQARLDAINKNILTETLRIGTVPT